MRKLHINIRFEIQHYNCDICTQKRMAAQTIDRKDIAKSLFINGAYTQEEIAAKVGTTRQTVARWMRDGAWEELKASLTITPDRIIAQFHRQIMEINNRINSRENGSRFATPAEADSLSKLAGAVRKLETDIGVADCVSVAMRFLSWLRPQDMDAARRFNDLFDAFIKDQARQ